MAIAHSKRYAIPGGMNQSVRNLQKRLLQQKIELKKKLATELAISIDELRKDVEPWVEIVDGKEYVFKKVENISSNFFIDIKSTPKISKECDDTLSRSKLKINDILFSIAGTLGRTAIVQDKDLPANTNPWGREPGPWRVFPRPLEVFSPICLTDACN